MPNLGEIINRARTDFESGALDHLYSERSADPRPDVLPLRKLNDIVFKYLTLTREGMGITMLTVDVNPDHEKTSHLYIHIDDALGMPDEQKKVILSSIEEIRPVLIEMPDFVYLEPGQ